MFTIYYLGPIKRARVSSEQDLQKSVPIQTESRTLRTRQHTTTLTTSTSSNHVTSVQLRSAHVSFYFKGKNIEFFLLYRQIQIQRS